MKNESVTEFLRLFLSTYICPKKNCPPPPHLLCKSWWVVVVVGSCDSSLNTDHHCERHRKCLG